MIRLSPSARLAPRHPGTPDTLPPFGAYFCSDYQCRTVRKHGINPKNRSADSCALKLRPFNSTSPSALAELCRTSKLRGTRSDTVLLVDLRHPSQTGVKLVPERGGLIGTNDVPVRPAHLHSVKDFTDFKKSRKVSLDLRLLLKAYDVKAPNLAVLVAALLEGSMDGLFPLQKWQRAAWLALQKGT